jgi:predicted DNA-binding protein
VDEPGQMKSFPEKVTGFMYARKYFLSLISLDFLLPVVYIVNTIYHARRCYMTTQMIVRIDSTLKNKVSNFAKAEGKNVSEIVRELLESYVKNRDIGSYIDDLWSRIGTKIKNKGFGSDDIDSIIQKIRAEK